MLFSKRERAHTLGVSFPSLWQIPEMNQFEMGKVYFGVRSFDPWSLGYIVVGHGSKARHYGIVEVANLKEGRKGNKG